MWRRRPAGARCARKSITPDHRSNIYYRVNSVAENDRERNSIIGVQLFAVKKRIVTARPNKPLGTAKTARIPSAEQCKYRR